VTFQHLSGTRMRTDSMAGGRLSISKLTPLRAVKVNGARGPLTV